MSSLTDTAPNFVAELNLMHYLAILRRRWFLLVIGAVLGAVAAFLYTTNQAPTYTTRSDIAVVRTGFVVNLNPDFRTVSDTDPNAMALDQVARRRSLVALGTSLSFAETVIARMGTQLPESLHSPEALRSRVDIRADNDLIQVDVTHASPELAALIANVWAETYAERLNQVFGETALTLDSFDTQTAQAKQDYDAKQQALEAYLGTSPVDRLTRERDLIALQLNNQVQLEGKLVQLQTDAQALRALIASGAGDAAAGDELSRVLLQASSFNNSGSLPLQLDIPFSALEVNTTRAQQVAQLDSLLITIQARRAALGGENKTGLYTQLGSVQQQLEQAQAKTKELQAERDLSWNIYQLLLTKAGETGMVNGNQNQLVRVASTALVPTTPTDSRLLLKTMLGALAGLVAGAAVALFIRAS